MRLDVHLYHINSYYVSCVLLTSSAKIQQTGIEVIFSLLLLLLLLLNVPFFASHHVFLHIGIPNAPVGQLRPLPPGSTRWVTHMSWIGDIE